MDSTQLELEIAKLGCCPGHHQLRLQYPGLSA